MDSARKHRKSHHVFEGLPKELYKLRKLQIKKFKEAREREDTRRILAKQTQINFLLTANMLLQISLAVTLTGFVYPFANY